jgi:glycosyltransferase involved in cell wall biosynthesis
MNNSELQNRFKLGVICASDFVLGVRGGAAGFVSNVMDDFSADQVIVFGISLGYSNPWEAIKINDKVHFLPICKLSYPSIIPMRLKVLLFYFLYRNKIYKHNIDLLYIHTLECCLPFIFFKKAPLIYHQHGSANPVELSRFSYARSLLFKKIFELILKLVHKKIDWIIAIDRLCYLKAINNGAEKKTTLLRNAINIKIFKPNKKYREYGLLKYKIDKDKRVILFVGRIEKTKGVMHLIKCITYFKLNKIRFHIFFAGDGSYLQIAKNYVKENDFDYCVTFLGSVGHSELPIYYNMADVLVLPSEMEGIPMVILESLACGTPVVASRVGGIPDIIINGKNGFLVDDLSQEYLAKNIIKALNNNINRETIASTVNQYSNNEFMRHFDEITKKLISST